MKILLADKSSVGTSAERDAIVYARTMMLTELLADHLPSLPGFMQELRTALEDGSTHLERVVKALQIHPAVCENFARIGSMAEPAEPIRLPLDHLIILLGKQRTWSTALAAYLLTEINSSWSTFSKQELADIALNQARQLVDQAKMMCDDEPEQSFVKGILSIAGLLPMIEAGGITDCAPEWLGTSKEAVEVQRDLFGTDFIELNCWIRVLWGVAVDFPFAAREAVETVTKDRSIAVAVPVSDPVSRNLVIVPRGN